MSLINQMLRDLEQRRTTGLGSSPLSGLSASGLAAQPVGFSINYLALSIVVTIVFVGGVLVAYLLNSQQQTITTENTLSITAEKETSVFSIHNMPKKPGATALSAMILPTIIKPDSIVVAKEKIVDTVLQKPITKKMTPVVITPGVENIIEETPPDREKNINKTIRPLTQEQQSQLAFQHAIHLLSRNDQKNAQLALEEALSFSPAHLRARETLAAILLNTGRISEAANYLKEGLHLMPDAAPLAKLYARILMDQGDIAAAVMALEQARPTVTADPEYYALLAALYQQMKKYAQAAQVYQQILLQRPGIAAWWMGLALAHDAMGQTVHALDAFQRAQRAGGLSNEVLKYVQTRIVALTPILPVAVDTQYDLDEYGE